MNSALIPAPDGSEPTPDYLVSDVTDSARAARPLPPVAERVLIVGLDGATFNVLDPLMAEGRMPRLQAAIASGASGPLRSTTPPLTPAAWTTFLTGQEPGRHGIIDFEQYDHRTNGFYFNSSGCLGHVRNIWRILSEQGLRVGSINVPMTYPPAAVNGFLVSGFETPGPESDFVHPRELKPEILARWSDPTQAGKWKRRLLGGRGLFRKNVDYMSRSFHQGAEMTTYLGDRFGWDALMVVLKLVDNLQHKTWRYIDPRWADHSPVRREIVKGAFEELDKAVGVLLDYAKVHGAAVMIVSDHGHGSLEGKVQPNVLLRQWGYLTLLEGAAKREWEIQQNKKPDRPHIGDVEREIPIDYSRTKACIMHAGNAAFVYVNLRGRQPTGIVEPQDYEPLRDEMIRRFRSEECHPRYGRGSSIPLFIEVHKPEEIYDVSRQEQPWLPDLILIPHEVLAVTRQLRGGKTVRWLATRKIEGTHRFDGIFIATGPGVTRTRVQGAKIIDCAPTLLAMMGLRVPTDMTGRVLMEIFSTSPVVEREAAQVLPRQAPRQAAYTEDELRVVTDRLSDLGYLQ